MNTIEAEDWIEAQLAADAALQTIVQGRVYRYVAPPAAKLPFIVLSVNGSADVNGIGVTRLATNHEPIVRVVGAMDMISDLTTAAQCVDGDLVAGTGSQVGCLRISPLSYTTLENGQYYRHVGGRYQMFTY